MLSSTLKLLNSRVIWNERTSPRRARWCATSFVMSAPSKTMRPRSHASWPPSSDTSVVLPAPLGPISACTSPACTCRSTPAVATTPPNCLRRPCTSSSTFIAPPQALQQARQPAPREQHHGQQHPAGPELPVLRVRRDAFLQQQQHRGAEHAAPQRRHAAEDDHHHQRARLRPVQHVGADVALLVDAERAGEAAEHAGGDEDDQLAAVGREAERLGALVVVAHRDDGTAEPRAGEAVQPPQGRAQHRQRHVVERRRVLQVQAEERRTRTDVQALVAAVAFDRVARGKTASARRPA